jgi:hypothetical protein
MKPLVTLLASSFLTVTFLAVPCRGQERPAQEVELGTTTSGNDTCVEVEIGGQKATGLNCLNQQLKHEVDRLQATPTIAPLDARSAAVHVGGFSETAMSEQYGKNFGKSVVPFRPAPPIFAPATVAH